MPFLAGFDVQEQPRSEEAAVEDATVQCWGAGYGNGVTPVTISGLGGAATQVVVGAEQVCALLANGLVQCWPDGSHPPATVLGLGSATVIAAGDQRVRSFRSALGEMLG